MAIREQILGGRYAYGDRLPAERQLAAHFGASRGTVREALRRLEERSLIVRRAGSGTFVNYRAPGEREDVAETTSPLELIDVRCAVEPHMVRLAVMNAGARDLERLRAALGAVESCGNNPDTFSRADEAFHLALAACSRNPLMLWLYEHINDIRGHTQWSARKDKILTPRRIREYNRQHRAIFQAVMSRDIELAVRSITAHLDKARADLLGRE